VAHDLIIVKPMTGTKTHWATIIDVLLVATEDQAVVALRCIDVSSLVPCSRDALCSILAVAFVSLI
jgi:hypothetical protein